jgi:hypothetical protein
LAGSGRGSLKVGDLKKKTVTNVEELKEAIVKADGQTMVSIALESNEREVPDNAKGGKLRA